MMGKGKGGEGTGLPSVPPTTYTTAYLFSSCNLRSLCTHVYFHGTIDFRRLFQALV